MSTDSKALDLFEIFDTNKSSEEDGVWADLNGTTKFRIRAFNCKAASDLRDKEVKPYQTLVRAGIPIPDDKNEEIGRKVIAGALLSDWQGVVLDGAEVPFSADAAYALIKKLPKLADFVARWSMDAQNYKDQAKEDALKN